MPQWEYCAVRVGATYRDGTGGEPIELLSVKLPDAPWTTAANPLGVVGLLNDLGADRWELVDVEGGTYYLKRAVVGAS